MTDLCNFHCSYCQAKRRRQSSLMWNDTATEALKKLLKNRSFTHACLSGGEPMRDAAILKTVISILRNSLPENAGIVIHTNGSYLTPDLADYLNEQKISADISINFTGEKGLINLLHHSAVPLDFVGTIRRLQAKTIHIVAKRKQKFAEEAVLLKQIFDCPVVLATDNMKWRTWDETDAEWLKSEWLKLKNYDKMCFNTWCIIEQFSANMGPYGKSTAFYLPNIVYEAFEEKCAFENTWIVHDMDPALKEKINALALSMYEKEAPRWNCPL